MARRRQYCIRCGTRDGTEGRWNPQLSSKYGKVRLRLSYLMTRLTKPDKYWKQVEYASNFNKELTNFEMKVKKLKGCRRSTNSTSCVVPSQAGPSVASCNAWLKLVPAQTVPPEAGESGSADSSVVAARFAAGARPEAAPSCS